MTRRRLIEAAFPLKQASLDSVHEKNVRHGHISTLHIWPARRPLAASRAALLATLLPDPGTSEGRREVLRRMAGTVVETPDAKGERMREETRGGILHWGREGAYQGSGPAVGAGRAAGGGPVVGAGPASGAGRTAGVGPAVGADPAGGANRAFGVNPAAGSNPAAGASRAAGANHDAGDSPAAGASLTAGVNPAAEASPATEASAAAGISPAAGVAAGVGIDAFREQVRQAFGGRAPRVLDPFAGGGAIPLEAMRLGCEAVASDLNPVAWFVLRCTLRYPHLLAGQRRPLPEFALRDRAFATAFLKGQGVKGRKALRQCLAALGHGEGGSGIDQNTAHEGMQTLLGLGSPVTGGTGQGVALRRVDAGMGAGRSAADATGQSAALGRNDGGLDAGRLAHEAGGQAPSAPRRSDGAAHPSADALDAPVPVEADFAWHLRAWGQRILERARRALAAHYPTYAEFEPLRRKGRGRRQVRLERRYRPRPRQLLAPDDAGRVSTVALNAQFDALYLEDAANPRWVAKPTVAYLWARTVRCAGCRKEVPLLKTRWLCRKGAKRVLLTMAPGEEGEEGEDGVAFGVESDVPAGGAGERRQNDQQLGAGTMSKSGATCPCCGVIATMADLRAAGRAGQLGERLTAVVVEGQEGKEYRLPTDEEVDAARIEEEALADLYAELPFGLPEEPTPKAGVGASRAFSIDGYGFDTWRKLFTNRQLLALGTFIRELRSAWVAPGSMTAETSSEADGATDDAARRPGTAKVDSISAHDLAGALEAGDVGPNAGPSAHDSAEALEAGGVGSASALAPSAQTGTEMAEEDGSSLPTASPQRERDHAVDRLDDYPEDWREALAACLSLSISRLADRGSSLATWTNDRETFRSTFARFALPIVWDFSESCPLADTSGSFGQAIEWIARVVEHLQAAAQGAPQPQVLRQSAVEPLPSAEPSPGAESPPSAEPLPGAFDLICTDPPYYDAIPYSDLMDFFHVWLRRALHGLSPETDAAFANPLGPKWSAAANDGELIDDAARFGGDKAASKRNYEDGMARSFARFHQALREDGRLVIVFANKQPDAWETLVSALIRAGFVVVGSWPIQTEMQNRQRSLSSAALSSSIWLVCRKRPAAARPGWDRQVLEEMQANIRQRLRDFWDAGIRGPDFVWAATGPALEAFSRHPVVKFTDAPGERLSVAEFLRQVRRMVVGFVVSRLFEAGDGAMQELDDPTTYYLLHRNDFGLAAAPAGACILYALSCNLSDADLAGRLDLLVRGGGGKAKDAGEDGEDGENDEDANGQTSGSEALLKPWSRRRAKDLGEPAADGGPPPLIDCLHRLMRLWKTGEQSRVDAYLESRGLWRHELFARVVQALIELAETGSDERATLEYIQNHLAAQGAAAPQQEALLGG